MMISFGWTEAYLPPHGPKDTTRRLWKDRTFSSWCKAWDDGRLTHDAVDKCLAYGGKRIGKIILKERPFYEQLFNMPEGDVLREGGMVNSVDEFIDKYFNGDRNQIVAVIRFDFLPYELGQEEAIA